MNKINSFSLKSLLLAYCLAPYIIYTVSNQWLARPRYIFHSAAKDGQRVEIIALSSWGTKKTLYSLVVQPFYNRNQYDLNVVNNGEPSRKIGVNLKKQLDIYVNEHGVFMRGIKVDDIRPASLIVYNAEKQEIVSVCELSETDSRLIATNGQYIFVSEAWKKYRNSTNYVAANSNR